MRDPSPNGTRPDRRLLAASLTLVLGSAMPAQFGANYRGEPIRYGTHAPNDVITKLQGSIRSGKTRLSHERNTGYLASLLEELHITPASQNLVFSKTSFQVHRITPHNPRAIYFGDEVYVGFVPGGEVLEITAMDPHRGPIFYTLDQTDAARPKFTRRTHECMSCHGGARTDHWPGNLIRSVYTEPTGHVVTRVGSFVTTQASPFEERWGGWYVTGTHGKMRHMGNLTVADSTGPVKLDLDRGANITDLEDRISTSDFLTPHSDIVSLMVLEHQAEMHNLIARAGYRVRTALHRLQTRNKLFDVPADRVDDATKRVVKDAADQVLEHLLFKNETPLPAPVVGTSGFTKAFGALGPADSKGRSLRDLDLNTRLFRFPCSYVIYSPCFDALPREVLDRVYSRLWRILTGTIGRRSWRLTRDQRQAILDILLATKPNLPPSFKPTVVL